MTAEKINEYAEKTQTYLSTKDGQINWKRNVGMRYSPQQNYAAAVLRCCNISRYENLSDVVSALIG